MVRKAFLIVSLLLAIGAGIYIGTVLIEPAPVVSKWDKCRIANECTVEGWRLFVIAEPEVKP